MPWLGFVKTTAVILNIQMEYSIEYKNGPFVYPKKETFHIDRDVGRHSKLLVSTVDRSPPSAKTVHLKTAFDDRIWQAIQWVI